MKQKLFTTAMLLLFALAGISQSFGAHRHRKTAPKPLAAASSIYSFTWQGAQRTYRVYTPSGYNPSVPTQAVLYLHGGGGNDSEGLQLTSYADRYGFILILPQGMITSTLGAGRYSWNPGKTTVDGKVFLKGSLGIDDVGYIRQVILNSEQTFNIDPQHIYATGFSNGASMTISLGCELHSMIAAFAASTGEIEDSCVAGTTPPFPVMHIHGTGDPCHPYLGADNYPGCGPGVLTPLGLTLNFAPATAVNDRMIAIDGCTDASAMTYRNGGVTCSTNTTCSGGTMVSFCTVTGSAPAGVTVPGFGTLPTGMGHCYPGFAQYAPASLIGPCSENITSPATVITFDQVWEFFQLFSLGTS